MKKIVSSLLLAALFWSGCVEPTPEAPTLQVTSVIKNWQDISEYPQEEMIISGQALLVQKNLLFFFDSENFRESIVVDYNRLPWENREKIDAFDLKLKPMKIKAIVNKHLRNSTKPAVIAIEVIE
jgi:hypothetical protein